MAATSRLEEAGSGHAARTVSSHASIPETIASSKGTAPRQVVAARRSATARSGSPRTTSAPSGGFPNRGDSPREGRGLQRVGRRRSSALPYRASSPTSSRLLARPPRHATARATVVHRAGSLRAPAAHPARRGTRRSPRDRQPRRAHSPDLRQRAGKFMDAVVRAGNEAYAVQCNPSTAAWMRRWISSCTRTASLPL